jgi:uncharacterized protein YjbI with pentapeptide repeats
VAWVVLLTVAVSVVTGWVDWAVGRWAWYRAVLLGLWLLGGLLLAGAGYSWWRARRPRRGYRRSRRLPPLSWWAVAAAALVMATVVWGVTAWLLREAVTADDPAAARVEAIKTGLGVGAGTGGVFVLLLAVRRQWHQEITAIDTTFDATERRVTELYTKAADQLGSDKAPVRLAGLYALERLAQDNPSQRQTIVNVLCAYLRMPYTPPGEPPTNDDPKLRKELLTEHREAIQEREVRLAAQRILPHHLQPENDETGDPVETFWTDIDLDLTGAALIDFGLDSCTMRTARFRSATFTGNAGFFSATFTGNADFTSATFTDEAVFYGATFIDHADFGSATFSGETNFWDATFLRNADFTSATFTDTTYFRSASCAGTADFTSATFTASADFRAATFTGTASFTSATFAEGMPSEMAQFWPLPGDEAGDSKAAG